MRTKPVAERFWPKVRKTDGCWEWTAGVTHFGHGRIRLTIEPKRHANAMAHRVSYELHHGPIPAGKLVLHKCDNPKCVRPDHLELGDHTKNARDRSARGRNADRRGDRHPNAKATPSIVCKIRSAYRAECISQRSLAERYGMTQSWVSRIIKREAWRHLP